MILGGVFLVTVLVHVTTSSSLKNVPNVSNRFVRQASCKRLEYRCSNGECIPSYNVCDGAKDCTDGSDETRSACRASGIKCPSLAFECRYGACIDRELHCNGQADCADGSDEENCSPPKPTTTNSCGPLKFRCSNGQCINTYDTCDGIKNCGDGSDETKSICSELTCPSSSFQCDYGACLEPSVKCDGKSDCPDLSDERNCGNINNRPNFTHPSPEGGCRLPSHPKHGAYSGVQCDTNDPRAACRSVPGTLVDKAWVLKYSCDSQYSLNQDSAFSICENGQWQNVPECIKLCRPLKSSSVNIKCQYNGKDVPCDQPMRPDTSATAECKQHYTQNYVPEYRTMYCLANGEWTFPLFQCTPVCGVQLKQPTALVANGEASHQGEFPWLAALYYLNESQQWEQKCGGTLISPHIILTAAHCLVQQDNTRLKPSELKVGLGKYYRDYYRNEPSSVIADVKEVIVRKQYAGQPSYYALDIGLLDLVQSVPITGFVMPACVDWGNTFKPQPNAEGLAAGWGATDTGFSSEVVLFVRMNYIGYDDCLKMIRGALKGLLTHDKFCAGSSPNGGRVENGDSGGGLTFLKNGLHFLIGVVSTKIPDENRFRLFTDITNDEHKTWLTNHRDRLKLAHQEL